jgi:hypothetical protein
MYKQVNKRAPIINPSIIGTMKIEKIFEKINPIAINNNTYLLDYSTSTSNTLYCADPSNTDMILNIKNLPLTESGTITISAIINTSVNKKYFKTVQLNDINQDQIAINGIANLSIQNNAKFVLQQITFIYVNNSILNIITSLISLW